MGWPLGLLEENVLHSQFPHITQHHLHASFLSYTFKIIAVSNFDCVLMGVFYVSRVPFKKRNMSLIDFEMGVTRTLQGPSHFALLPNLVQLCTTLTAVWGGGGS